MKWNDGGIMLKVMVAAVLIGAVGWWVWGMKTNTAVPDTEEVRLTSEAQVETNPFFIDSLRARKPTGEEFKVEGTVRQTAKFTSYKVSYKSDGLKQYALMNKPVGESPAGGWPVVVVNHGHIEPSIYSTENSYINTSAYYAGAGFLVLKPDYRGHGLSEGDAGGVAARLNYAVDVVNLLALLPDIADANEEKVFMYGHSMGGDVTLRVLETTNIVDGASLWAPAVTTFPESILYFSRKRDSERRVRLESELAATFEAGDWDKVSTLANVDKVQVPVVIHHGTADESVPFAWGEALAAKMKESGKNVELFIYPNDNHDISRQGWGQALQRDVNFFLEILGSGQG